MKKPLIVDAQYLGLIGITVLLYFAAGKVSLLLLHGHHIVNIGVFPSEGIALALALFFGKRIWPGIFFGQLLLALSNGITVIPSIEISLINSLEAILGVTLFHRYGFHIHLKHFRDIIGLAGLILFILQPFSAVFSNLALMFSDQIERSTFFYSTFSWWFGNVMGQLLFTPFVLLLLRNHAKIRFISFFLYGLLFILAIYGIEIILATQSLLLLLSLTIPAVIFVVARKEITYGMLFTVLLALVSAYSVYLGVGAFYLPNAIDNVINFNLFILAHIVTVFTASILFEQRRTLEQTLQSTIKHEIAKNNAQQLMMLQQSRLAQMGEMIAMIAHQWRQPLNNLSLVNQLLIIRYNKNKLDDEMMDYFKEHSKKYIQLMSTTIDDFRDFFRTEKESEVFSLNEVMERVLGITQAIYANSGIRISLHASHTLMLYGHSNDLGQAVLNIINNARDALIERKQAEKDIHIALTRDDENTTIHITDNAGGISSEIIDKIFDPYFSTKENKNGTGLGLYMAKMIIHEKFGGIISVTNTDHGAYFTIILPNQEHND